MNDANDNAVVVEAWNTILFDKFVKYRHIVVGGLSNYSDYWFAHNEVPAGARVLDVGCGFGDTTIRLAKAVGPAGRAEGVDCAPNFILAAANEARDAGVGNAGFFVADVQHEDLRGPWDHAFARFGTMFFNLPGAALRNVRRHLKPGGTFTQIVWRKREDNPWVHEAELCVRDIVPVVDHEGTDQVHCGPGPFSMASPDLVSGLLRAAGFERMTFERVDADIMIGRDLADAVDFAMALGPAGEIIRLAAAEGEKRRPQVAAALKQVLSRYARPDGVWAPSSAWVVTARNPG
jgi:ubiquinone/menaquinone biosynthesis C-methylase UbiE